MFLFGVTLQDSGVMLLGCFYLSICSMKCNANFTELAMVH